MALHFVHQPDNPPLSICQQSCHPTTAPFFGMLLHMNAKNFLEVAKSQSPEPQYNIADLTQYQWYVCPDETCLYQSKYSHDFEQHMTNNHNSYKDEKIMLDMSGDKTMMGRREQKSFESSFETMPKNVRDDYENHKILQLTESLDVLPGMIVLLKNLSIQNDTYP